MGPLVTTIYTGFALGVVVQCVSLMGARDRGAVTSTKMTGPRILTKVQPANDTRYIINPVEYNATMLGDWFPVMVQEKYDGIRATIKAGVAYSRSGKPIPNLSFQTWVQNNAEALDNCDGELMAGNTLQDAQSFAMSKQSKDAFTYMIFNAHIEGFTCTPYQIAKTPADITPIFEGIRARGGEGVVIKTIRGNRAMKLKAWQDSEAIVTARDGKTVTLDWQGKTFAMVAPANVRAGDMVKFKYRDTYTTGRPRDVSFMGVRAGDTMPAVVSDLTGDNVTVLPSQGKAVLIADAVSGLRNLGMTKAKATSLVNITYDSYDNTPSLSVLITDSIKALTPS